MAQYVYWLSDIWGWDTDPSASRADLHRELEVGRLVMVMERWENTNPGIWFSSLAYEIQVRGRV